MLLGFGVLVDYSQQYIDLGVNIPVSEAICTYIILMEVGSIIENLGAINPQIVPSKLKSYFLKLTDQSTGKEDEEDVKN